MVAAVIHLLPGLGVVGGGVLERAYGVEVGDPTMELLLRHRAILFAILGTGFAIAAFRREWQSVAIVAALVSMLSFIALALTTPGRTPQIGRLALVDAVVSVLLVVAVALRARSRTA